MKSSLLCPATLTVNRPITPFIEEKFNLSKNNIESYEGLKDQKDYSCDNLYYNQKSNSIKQKYLGLRNRSPFHEELRRDSVGWNYLTVWYVGYKNWKIYRDIEVQREVTAHVKFKDGWIQNGVKMLHQEIIANFKLRSA
ncbi:hypothetical protein Avbf_12562 [Armadillidium vulgare]|nr:hypothetical protein Avbf_12562 [Armadillidium vulgare]